MLHGRRAKLHACLVDAAAVVVHPAPLDKTHFEKVNLPISFICAEGLIGQDVFPRCCGSLHHDSEDFFFNTRVKKMAQDIMTNKPGLASELKTGHDARTVL
jgi:hypothetical protein